MVRNLVRAVPGEDSAEEAADPQVGVVRFEVVDTGIGISPEAQLQLFAPFTETGPSEADKKAVLHENARRFYSLGTPAL